MNNLYGAPHCSLGPIVDENSGGRKTLFWHFSITKFARKLLNVRSPQALKFTEITALVPFSTPTRLYTHPMKEDVKKKSFSPPLVKTRLWGLTSSPTSLLEGLSVSRLS